MMYNASLVTDANKIEEELREMQEYLELPFRSDDISTCLNRLEALNQYMARSGKLKADAEWHYFQLYNSSVMGSLKDIASKNLSATMLNKYVESCCKDYKQLIVWADRVNRSCVHQIDTMRTIVSYAKSERTYS